MVFYWNGITFDDFLIRGLEVTTFQGFAIVILVIVALSILYEAIRTFRDLLMDNFIELKNQSTLQAGDATLQVKYASGNDSVTTKLRVIDLESRKHSNELTQETQQVVQTMELSAPGSSNRSPEVDGIIISKNQWSNCLTLMAASILHMVDVCLGYTLMLAVMTFNGWILVAVAAGSGVGYLIFSYLKQALREGNYRRSSLATNK